MNGQHPRASCSSSWAQSTRVLAVAALASTGCAGLLALDGYSGAPAEAAPTDEAGLDGRVPVGDGSPPRTDDAAVDGAISCPLPGPITAAQIDARGAWRAPRTFENVCSQSNIDALKSLLSLNPGGVPYADIKIAVGPACSACVFSTDQSGSWQVLVETADAGAIDNRTGSCFAQRSGAACGQARFRVESCLLLACPDEGCGLGGGFYACARLAEQGACRALTETYLAACPGQAADQAACGTIFGAIATSCSGGPGHVIKLD